MVNRWRIIGEPRQYQHNGFGIDIEVGWLWTIQGNGTERHIRVEVTDGASSAELPPDSLQAIRTQGRSATEAYLDRVMPPLHIWVTRGGLVVDRAI